MMISGRCTPPYMSIWELSRQGYWRIEPAPPAGILAGPAGGARAPRATPGPRSCANPSQAAVNPRSVEYIAGRRRCRFKTNFPVGIRRFLAHPAAQPPAAQCPWGGPACAAAFGGALYNPSARDSDRHIGMPGSNSAPAERAHVPLAHHCTAAEPPHTQLRCAQAGATCPAAAQAYQGRPAGRLHPPHRPAHPGPLTRALTTSMTPRSTRALLRRQLASPPWQSAALG